MSLLFKFKWAYYFSVWAYYSNKKYHEHCTDIINFMNNVNDQV